MVRWRSEVRTGEGCGGRRKIMCVWKRCGRGGEGCPASCHARQRVADKPGTEAPLSTKRTNHGAVIARSRAPGEPLTAAVASSGRAASSAPVAASPRDSAGSFSCGEPWSRYPLAPSRCGEASALAVAEATADFAVLAQRWACGGEGSWL